MILDQFGQPIRPSVQQQLARELVTLELPNKTRPSESLAAVYHVEQLRQSCGLAPATIKFRRSLPYGTET